MIDWRDKKGITLLALVVTIIVIVIIAAVAISSLMFDNDFFGKISKSVENYNLATFQEDLENIKVAKKFKLEGRDVKVSEYLEELQENINSGNIKAAVIESVVDKTDGENKAIVLVNNKYKFLVQNKKFGDNKYGDVEIIYRGKFTGELSQVDFDVIPYQGKYDGKAHKAVEIVNVYPQNATFTYDGETEIPEVTDVSEFTITVLGECPGYISKETTVTVTVTPGTGGLTLSASSGTYTYPNSGTFTVTKNVSGGELSISVYPNDADIATVSLSGNTVTVEPGMGSGEVTITVTSDATTNYEAQSVTYKAVVDNAGMELTFPYTGSEQSVTLPAGTYKMECWGAEGGAANYSDTDTASGGKGAYTAGTLELENNTTFYVYVGGQGINGENETKRYAGGYNGGGQGASYVNGTKVTVVGGSGGGATDIRITDGAWDNITSLRSRIMVAAGGGGAQIRRKGSYGGDNTTLTGRAGGTESLANYDATQTSAGTHSQSGGFGYGGRCVDTGSVALGPGGSGGYYGGSGGGESVEAGAGSSFISGHSGCNAINSDGSHTGQPNHFSEYVFTNTSMINGNAEMPTHDGTGTMIGNSGDGYVKITRTK